MTPETTGTTKEISLVEQVARGDHSCHGTPDLIAIVISLISLLVAISKSAFDVFIAPRRHQERLARERAEIRRETVAQAMRQFFGLNGAKLLADLNLARTDEDIDSLAAACEVIHGVAQSAYEVAETINDALEVQVGILMVTSSDLAEWLNMWVQTGTQTDNFHQFDPQITLITQTLESIQDRTHVILGPPINE